MGTDNLAIIKRACTAFQQHVGKQATLAVREAADHDVNTTLLLRPKGAKVDRHYAVEFVPFIDAPAAARLLRDWNAGEQKIVITYFLPVDLAIKFKQGGIPFLDVAGNVHLAEPGFFLFIAGCPKPPDLAIPTKPRPARTFNVTGVRVLFVLLARPDYLNRPYREIADAAKVALGTVAGLMGDLKEQGYLIDIGKDGKRLQQKEKLIDEWTTAYARDFLHRQTTRRFRAEKPDWWQTAELGPLDVLWGGDVAAERLTGYLKPGDVTVYAKNDTPPLLLKAQRMRADPNGDVTVIEAFWNFAPDETELVTTTVPPLLVYADLMATGDPRAIETAGLIREKWLA